jgi:hypothetical protein
MTSKDKSDSKKIHGEGNPEADRRYREGVEETVEHTTEAERAEKARSLEDKEKARAREAEEEGKSHARK